MYLKLTINKKVIKQLKFGEIDKKRNEQWPRADVKEDISTPVVIPSNRLYNSFAGEMQVVSTTWQQLEHMKTQSYLLGKTNTINAIYTTGGIADTMIPKDKKIEK